MDNTVQQAKTGHIHGTHRIYAPISYPLVRTSQFVRVVHTEVMPLAIWFPIIWHYQDGLYQLMAMRTMLASGDGQPPGSPRNAASLPLIFRAYPFFIKHVDEKEGTIVAIDGAVADEPTDKGAAILTAAQKLGRGAEQRFRALALFSQGLPQTEAMTDFLVEHELLEPWPLEAQFGGERLEVKDLFVVRPRVFDTGDLRAFCLRFGASGVHCLSGHRLSLFRARALVSAAERAHVSKTSDATG